MDDDGSLTFFLGILFSVFLLFVVLYIYPRFRITIFDPPYLVTIMFFGYAGGMLYFPQHDLNQALFLSKVPLGDEDDVRRLLLNSSVFVFIAVALYIVGALQAAKRFSYMRHLDFSVNIRSKRLNLILSSVQVQFLSLALTLLGFTYLVYYSRLAGGFWVMIESFSYYQHLVEEIGISTLPFNLMYLGFFLSLAHLVARRLLNKLISPFSILSCLASFLISSFSFLIQARIYPFIGLIVVALMSLSFPVNRPLQSRINKKYIFAMAMLPISAIIILALRNENSQSINGLASQIDLSNPSAIADYVLYQLIGRGNVVDIQQIAIVIKAWSPSDSLLGLTFFEFEQCICFFQVVLVLPLRV